MKRVIDRNAKMPVKGDGGGVDLGSVRTSVNPFDEVAAEEAIRPKEKGAAQEIVAVSIGAKRRRRPCARATGADRTIPVVAAGDVTRDVELLAAKILKAVRPAECSRPGGHQPQ